MTITTDLAGMRGGEPFAYRPATSRSECVLEIATGAVLAGIGLWRRGVLGTALAAEGAYLIYCGADDFRRPYQGRVRVAFTIAKDRQEVYAFVTNPENWNRFLYPMQVREGSEGRLRLILGHPHILDYESRFEVTDRKDGEYIAWASDAQMLEHRGVMHFDEAPAQQGTEVSVALEFKSPTRAMTHALASLRGWNPEQAMRESLRRLKQLLEAGEIPTTQGQPVGARGAKGSVMRLLYREPLREAPQAQLAGD